DGLFCLNFRADRAREILAALTHHKLLPFGFANTPVMGGINSNTDGLL
ncbi:MAG: hypothetical protein F6K31_42700, partial [Symploca sp. SIO2G7]|nr:hypothetical protein [Symploca sp. SIO2G7]